MPLPNAEVERLLRLQLELLEREERDVEGPKYDWYGPPCECELSRAAEFCPDHGMYDPGTGLGAPCGCPRAISWRLCPLHPRARPNQRPPEDETWLTWLVLAGRGFGKSRVGAEWIIDRAKNGPENGRYALIGKTNKDVRETMIKGESGILARSPPWFYPKFNVTNMTLEWPNGAKAFGYTSDQPAQLRGPQFHDAWGDELAHWVYLEECLSNLNMALRLTAHSKHAPRLVFVPRKVFTTTPLPVPAIKRLRDDPTTRVTRGSTYDNRANLAETAVRDLERQYEGTRRGRQELHAEVLEDNPGALWNGKAKDAIDADRRSACPELSRIVVGVDPSGTAKKDRKAHDEEEKPETGIVVAGRDYQDPPHFWVLEDASLTGSPDEWGRRVVEAYDRNAADRVVAERNFGGDMVEHTIRTVDHDVAFEDVWASRGKTVRAEPIVALYEQNRVHHVGYFPEMEAQMCSFDPLVAGQKSPDRVDALVWAITKLMDSVPAVWAESPFAEFRG